MEFINKKELPIAIRYLGKVYVMADEVESTTSKEDSFSDIEFINTSDSWLRYDYKKKDWNLEKYLDFKTKEIEVATIKTIGV